MEKKYEAAFAWLELSFLSDEVKAKYKAIMTKNGRQINIINP